MITVSTPTPADCIDLVRTLRPHDAAEMEAVGGITGSRLFEASNEAYHSCAVRIGGELVCIFGCGYGAEEGTGVPFLLGTRLLDRNMISLCKLAPAQIERWHDRFPFLINMTDKRNRRVLMWLRWLGFTLGHEVLVGPQQTPFIVFSRYRHHV